MTKATIDSPTRIRLREAYGRLPLSFEVNRGQTASQVKFLARASGHTLFLTPSEAVLVRHGGVLRMRLVGADPAPTITGLEQLPGSSNYFIDNDPSRWRTGVPNYARVRYQQIYRGIDLVFYGNGNQLEYDFTVAPGADPSAISLQFDGVRKLELDHDGALVLHTPSGVMRQLAPQIYQEIDGRRQAVAGRYILSARRQVRFQIEAYDSNRPLVIDPVVLVYSTYHGGSADDFGRDIVVDSSGNAYVTGTAGSTNFPTAGTYSWGTCANCPNPDDAFVTKFNAAGSARVFSTFLGTDKDEEGRAITLDPAGNVYIIGWTEKTGVASTFPGLGVSGGPANTGTLGGVRDVFVSKFNPMTGFLIRSFLVGGSNDDMAGGIAVDNFDAFPGSGNGTGVWIAGDTTSFDFPDVGTWVTPRGVQAPFILRFEDETLRIGGIYSGSSGGGADDIAVDPTGWAYVIGFTFAANFPTVNPVQATNGGGSDAFVMKIHPSGLVENATYLGGSGDEVPRNFGIAVQPGSGYGSSPAYVTGKTNSTNFPTTSGSFSTTNSGGSDAFVTKMTLPLSGSPSIVYSTYLGGAGNDGGKSIAVDAAGKAYVSGASGGTASFPLVNPVQPRCPGAAAFAAKLTASGAALVYSTQVGCGGEGNGIALDPSSNAYVTGSVTGSLPAVNSIQPSIGGATDGFVAKIEEAPATFTDDTLIFGGLGIIIKAVHINELRVRINAQRVRYGLSPYPWTDPTLNPGVTVGKAQHIIDLRVALEEAYVAGMRGPLPTYTDPNLAAGFTVKAVHITDLRSAVIAIE